MCVCVCVCVCVYLHTYVCRQVCMYVSQMDGWVDGWIGKNEEREAGGKIKYQTQAAMRTDKAVKPKAAVRTDIALAHSNTRV